MVRLLHRGLRSARLHRLARSPAPRPRCRWYRHHHGRRDLDQLVVAEPLAGEVVKVLVAVADVDALVAPGSAIDDHARSNTTSVYTAAKVFPMLPEKLSTDLTSLREGEERLAVVIEMTIDGEGRISASDVPSSTTAC
jgi:exoribonuclease R